MSIKHTFTQLLILSLLAACSKDSTQPQTSQSRTDLIIGKKWVMISMTGKLANGSIVGEQIGSLPDHKKDDYWYFKQDLSFELNDNMNKRPGTSSAILEKGTWKLINSDTYLDLRSADPGTTYFPTKILELSAAQMKWESTDPSDGTVIYTTYKAQ